MAPTSQTDPEEDAGSDALATEIVEASQTHSKSSSVAREHSIMPLYTHRQDTAVHHFVDVLPDIMCEVHIPLPSQPGLYEEYNVDARVRRVIGHFRSDGVDMYSARLQSGHLDKLQHLDLVQLPGGAAALREFRKMERTESLVDSDGSNVQRTLRMPKRRRMTEYVDLTQLDSSEESSVNNSTSRKRQRLVLRQSGSTPHYVESDSDDVITTGHSRSYRIPSRDQAYMILSDSESPSESDDSAEPTTFIDVLARAHVRKSRKFGSRFVHKSEAKNVSTRRSGRSNRARASMREFHEDDVPEVESLQSSKPKLLGAKETFSALPLSSRFRQQHLQYCVVCGDDDEEGEKGCFVFCQGCTDTYHVSCLGSRNNREHLVTKINKGNFVLQCKRCIDAPARKDAIAPYFSKCQSCMKPGAATRPFRQRKTAKEEHKEREDNNGKDPITVVEGELLNQPGSVMFRCVSCYCAWHLNHLPAREESLFEIEDEDERAKKRWEEYAINFNCEVCLHNSLKIEGIVAWRPKILAEYTPGTSPELISDDEKEYLVRWNGRSYYEAKWMPGPWLWSKASKTMLHAFYRRNDGQVPPIMRTEDAIPEEYLRVDIIFTVRYNNVVKDQIEEVDLARAREVEKAYVKYKGLGYEDIVWDQPPDPNAAPERWKDFKIAYDDWVKGNYIRLPSSSTLSHNLRKVRALPFEEKVMLKEQPALLQGGELMNYQLDGLNWLYYQWHRGQNAILADEMGLGKTIQVIGFLATLREKHHCWPFLVVVPNATCANWKREIRQWAPSLRVVTYFGSARSLELTENYDLFREGKKDLSCHIVVTSYEAAQNVNCQKTLRRVGWQVLVVDEGQRLKNDEGLLYKALSQLRAPFKLLLTGTPLQNNQRELFNLLQFLDHSKDANSLEQKYAELDKENIVELHSMLRPFFLRRTKVQVLDFLPTMAQIIVPVSMSGLQKELYKTILAKNAELLRSVFGDEKRIASKGGLRNILMQLRKCLCHPFVYSLEIEERSAEAAVSHQRLVEASAKLQLLELMLPKLQQRGHRVLIFSQFLDMLTIMEDFLQDLGLEHTRLDGSLSSMEKQKRIDDFNGEGSKIFAFLLSTRAGGVGINLATADTVIIMDPDFNPHQDIQAISRAHRIGQKKKVLVFQLTTRASAEEKIMQIGRKKMALDHAIIDSMEVEEDNADDLEAVLRFGAEALFKDDDSSDIRYDSASVDDLLNRSQVENPKSEKQNSVESQFSFARIWQNDTAKMVEADQGIEDEAVQPGVWDQILAERVKRAQAEAALKAEKLGRGKRRRKDVDYQNDVKFGDDEPTPSHPEKDDTNGDTDFQVQAESEEDDFVDDVADDPIDLENPEFTQKTRRKQLYNAPPPPLILQRPELPNPIPQVVTSTKRCAACGEWHIPGSCPLKIAGVEYCGLCGMAHFGQQRICPHLNSEVQVRLMLQALEQSPEPRELVDSAKKMLKALRGNLSQLHKKKAEKLQGKENAQAGKFSQNPTFAKGKENIVSAQGTGEDKRRYGPEQQRPLQQGLPSYPTPYPYYQQQSRSVGPQAHVSTSNEPFQHPSVLQQGFRPLHPGTTNFPSVNATQPRKSALPANMLPGPPPGYITMNGYTGVISPSLIAPLSAPRTPQNIQLSAYQVSRPPNTNVASTARTEMSHAPQTTHVSPLGTLAHNRQKSPAGSQAPNADGASKQGASN